MLEINNAGTPLGVNEMLFENSNSFVGFDSYVWETSNNAYPRLRSFINEDTDTDYNDPKTTTVTVTDNNKNSISDYINSGKSIIISGSIDYQNNKSNFENNDIYCKNSFIFINKVGKYSRVYGLSFEYAVMYKSTLIEENNGKISGTVGNITSSLENCIYYIKTNNGYDFNPTITIGEGAENITIYRENKGVVIYADIKILGDTTCKLLQETSSGKLVQSKLKLKNITNNGLLFNNMIDVYLEHGILVYTYNYYDMNGNCIANLQLDQTQDPETFMVDGCDFDFNDTWIKIIGNDKANQVVLRWELKENWYDRDIDLYSLENKEHSNYVWNSYINSKDISSSDDYTYTEINSKLEVKTAEGLAYFAKQVNHGKWLDVNVSLSNNIDLSGRLFTPIGGGYILDQTGKLINNKQHSFLIAYIILPKLQLKRTHVYQTTKPFKINNFNISIHANSAKFTHYMKHFI
jgi:hypothetical protein